MRKLAVALIASGVLAVGSGFVIARQHSPSAAVQTESHTPARSARPIGPIERLVIQGGLPFYGATKTTIDGAEAAIGQHVLRPKDPLASDDLIQTVWINVSGGQVAIDYTTGVREYATLTDPVEDPLGTDQAVANELIGASVETIQNVPALVIAGDTPGNCPRDGSKSAGSCVPAQNNATSATFYVQGFAIELDAPGTTSTDDIIRVAQSVA